MRDEIFSIMNRINKKGHYSKYDSRKTSIRANFDENGENSIQNEAIS